MKHKTSIRRIVSRKWRKAVINDMVLCDDSKMGECLVWLRGPSPWDDTDPDGDAEYHDGDYRYHSSQVFLDNNWTDYTDYLPTGLIGGNDIP
jgi:hypothetical protein